MSKKIKIGKSILETITVALYENPLILFREYVQNSLDAYNYALKKLKKNSIEDFYVNIVVDKKKKNIVIRDNGYAIEEYDLFHERMLSIGSSDKEQDRTEYIGFRGIGRISGLPFCDKLTFRNKAENSSKIYECIWEGEKYRVSLNDEKTPDDLATIISKITEVDEKDIKTETKEEHFFEVIIENYNDVIESMMNEVKFKEKLIKMLPLRYHKNFKSAKKIKNKYKEIMGGESLDKFMVSVKFSGEDLYKSYRQVNVLDSDIIFWPIIEKQRISGAAGDKIGLLWFTFERHPRARNINDINYGILVRSKNVLMGDNDTFAKVSDNSSTYVSTFTELSQTIHCVYGELLINSPNLHDNSRRDWFLPDQHRSCLEAIITDFMKRLFAYRYCASRYYRKNPTKEKEELEKILGELINIKDNTIDWAYFSNKEKIESEGEEDKKNEELFSDEDLPFENKTMKKYYDILMKYIREYFVKEKKVNMFLKLRAFLSNKFKKK